MASVQFSIIKKVNIFINYLLFLIYQFVHSDRKMDWCGENL